MNIRGSSVRTDSVSKVNPDCSNYSSTSTNTSTPSVSMEAMYLERISRWSEPNVYDVYEQYESSMHPAEATHSASSHSATPVNRYRGALVVGLISLGLLVSFFAEIGSPATPPQSVQSSQSDCALLQSQ